jgi:DNA polymerase phi
LLGFACAACLQSQEDQQKQKQQRRSPPDSQQLHALWRHFVEGACLSSSHERKALAIQLLQLLMPVMAPDMVQVLLSKQLLGCVATALKDKESYLHASAKRCLVSSAFFSLHIPRASPCSGF